MYWVLTFVATPVNCWTLMFPFEFSANDANSSTIESTWDVISLTLNEFVAKFCNLLWNFFVSSRRALVILALFVYYFVSVNFSSTIFDSKMHLLAKNLPGAAWVAFWQVSWLKFWAQAIAIKADAIQAMKTTFCMSRLVFN